MSKHKHLRYRIGIDVGLYSVGLSAIEIDDSTDNPFDAMPIKLLSCMSVIHDGAVDPDSNKTADSRKAISGVARRTRRLNKRKKDRLQKLDTLLNSLGYPVAWADSLVSNLNMTDPYFAWKTRISALEAYIPDLEKRRLAVTVALRHIARHRGWRNPYASTASLANPSNNEKRFYIEFFERVQKWKYNQQLVLDYASSVIEEEVVTGGVSKFELVVHMPDWEDESIWTHRPAAAELIEPLLTPTRGFRIRAEHGFANGELTNTDSQMGKLHQSDNYYEIMRILEMQRIPEEERKQLIDAVFFQINPKDVGAAAELVGFDDLQKLQGKQRRRSSRASLAFQRFRIITTISNLRIEEKQEKHSSQRILTIEEKQDLYDYLVSTEVASSGGITWHDVADKLLIDRNDLKGVGGKTEDGEPISAKVPPFLSTEYAILNAEGIRKELKPLAVWWQEATEYEKEWLIEYLGNAGMPSKDLSEQELSARGNVEILLDQLGKMDEGSLDKLERIKIASGRAAYSYETLSALSNRMYKTGEDLHAARKAVFGVDDDWHPTAEPLGTLTGNPAVDRTIKIVSRWLNACELEWGKPETVQLEHVREGFISPKKAREMRRDMNKRYQANLRIKEDIVSAFSGSDGLNTIGIEALRQADVRRQQAIQRQCSQCLYCGVPIGFSTAQMDHIVPRKRAGSTNTLDNLVAVCAACNSDKNNELFSSWAAKTPGRQKESIERVKGFVKDKYFSSEKQFRAYKRDVIARLKQTEKDDELDARSIESVAWMARELREQIQGHFGFLGKTVVNTPGISAEVEMQRVNVFSGSITTFARRASGLEGRLPWIGGASEKTRLDRRHHAIDASVIALMRPAVATVLLEREELKRGQQYCGYSKEQTAALGPNYWKNWRGSKEDNRIFGHWADEQMEYLGKLLIDAMNKDQIVVTNPLRLRLGHGRAHEDTIRPLIKRHVGDALTSINIDKAESSALWMALTSHPDYDPSDEPALPPDPSRCIRINDRWLTANDEIGFMAREGEFDVIKDAVYGRVRGGFAAIGPTIHHARFYRIPKLNKTGKQLGWQFAFMRVFQEDLKKSHKMDLFTMPIPPQAISRRSCAPPLRKALDEGTADYLGWAVVGDEVEINPDDSYYSPEKTSAINKFMKAFPGTRRFTIVGFGVNSKLSLSPIQISSEGIPDISITDSDNEKSVARKEKSKKLVYGDYGWSDDDISDINKLLGEGAPWTPSVDVFCSTLPTFIRRNTLGRIRYQSNNHMPVTWKVTAHPSL